MSRAVKPRICLLTETYHPVVGGGETQARTLAEGLASRGFDVFVITRQSGAELPRRERVGSVSVHRIGPVGPAHLKKWGLLFSTWLPLLRLRREYDLLFVSGFRILGIPAVLAGKLLGKITILKADSLGEMSGEFFAAGLARLRLQPSSLPFRLFLHARNFVLRRADGFVAISNVIAGELTANGISPQKIRHIPNSVDASRFCPVDEKRKAALRQKFDLPVRARVVIYTGRLVSYKGLPTLLRAWNEIQAGHDGVYLLLVGSGGLDIHNCESELRQYVRENRLQDSVCFTGNVQNVHEYLQAADVFAFPTENEAFGISLIEALACGLPAVATSIGGVKNILSHAVNGLVIPPKDHEALVQALDRLLSDRSLAARLGRAGRQTVHEKYASPQVIQQYIDLFNKTARIRHKAID